MRVTSTATALREQQTNRMIAMCTVFSIRRFPTWLRKLQGSGETKNMETSCSTTYRGGRAPDNWPQIPTDPVLEKALPTSLIYTRAVNGALSLSLPSLCLLLIPLHPSHGLRLANRVFACAPQGMPGVGAGWVTDTLR